MVRSFFIESEDIGTNICILNCQDERENIWKLYLDKHEFKKALKYAKTQQQKNYVNI